MSLYKRGETWWYRFEWRGDEIRESTKVSNQREAEKIEAARKTQLARDEVGLKGRKPAPTLREFVEKSFRPHIAVHFAEKIQTRRYYGFGLKAVLAYPALAEARLDEITADILNGFVARLQGTGWEVSTMNRTLQVLRRVFKLAQEWGGPRAPEGAPPARRESTRADTHRGGKRSLSRGGRNRGLWHRCGV
jgi:hypothetical protein